VALQTSGMRRLEFLMTDAQALGFLREAEVLHLAFTRPDGSPVLRTLNAAVTDEWLLFHGAPSGEKAACIGRPAVAQAEQLVATIPSYFTDPEKACPATTFFRSVQVHGTLERIEDPHVKADALQRIMQRYQPEGGYVPISFDTPMYQNAVRGVLVLGIRIQDVTGKAKLGQNKKPHEVVGIMDQLWLRGAGGDARAIALMFEYHPESVRPARFLGPNGTFLWPTLSEADVEAAVDLLENQYWTQGVPRDVLAKAQLGASAWVGAHRRTPCLHRRRRGSAQPSGHRVGRSARAPATRPPSGARRRPRSLGHSRCPVVLRALRLRTRRAREVSVPDLEALAAPKQRERHYSESSHRSAAGKYSAKLGVKK
jgi:nitroimidazol reductase NimA-like FMN-containing flavoprotein (pyridoxamine 5'-phosphate oxidase superfamily)